MSSDMGERLRNMRKKRGMTVYALGQKIGMHYTNIVRLEKGEYGKTLDKLPRIAKALGCRIDDLFPEMDADPGDEEVNFD